MLVFTETSESILGRVIEESQRSINGKTVYKRSLPKLGDDFLPTGERYEMWEVREGNMSTFFNTLEEAIEAG